MLMMKAGYCIIALGLANALSPGSPKLNRILESDRLGEYDHFDDTAQPQVH